MVIVALVPVRLVKFKPVEVTLVVLRYKIVEVVPVAEIKFTLLKEVLVEIWIAPLVNCIKSVPVTVETVLYKVK